MENVFVCVLERIKMLQWIHKERNVKKNIGKLHLENIRKCWGKGWRKDGRMRERNPDEEESIIELWLQAPINY